MTEGSKSPKDTLFFLNPESEDEKPKGKDKNRASAPKANGSPTKQKTIAGKVLRNQTRRAAQDEVHQTALAKLIEHQRELHERLQAEGLQKFSEDGGGNGGKEGKGWRKFQSYKGEGALPTEVERLRVCLICSFVDFSLSGLFRRFTLIAKRRQSSYPYTGLRFHFTLIPSRMLVRVTKATSRIYELISKHRVNSLERRRTPFVPFPDCPSHLCNSLSSRSKIQTPRSFVLSRTDHQTATALTTFANKSPI